MYTETKSQPDLGYPRPSGKFIKKSAIVSYDFLSLCEFWHKLRKNEKIITKNGWLFDKFTGGMWKFQIWLRFCLSVHILSSLILSAHLSGQPCLLQIDGVVWVDFGSLSFKKLKRREVLRHYATIQLLDRFVSMFVTLSNAEPAAVITECCW